MSGRFENFLRDSDLQKFRGLCFVDVPSREMPVNLGHLNAMLDAMLSVVQCDDAGPTCFFNRILDSRRADISSGLDTEKPTIRLSQTPLAPSMNPLYFSRKM